jgi:hypothetical protein
MAANSKNVLPPYHVINATSMAASITGAATNIQYLDNVSVQASWTSTPVGTIAIEGSLDHSANPITNQTINAGTWTTILSYAAGGAAGGFLQDMNNLSFPWIRVSYTRSSSSGTLDVYISGKAI